jgi:hypothetical protein
MAGAGEGKAPFLLQFLSFSSPFSSLLPLVSPYLYISLGNAMLHLYWCYTFADAIFLLMLHLLLTLHLCRCYTFADDIGVLTTRVLRARKTRKYLRGLERPSASDIFAGATPLLVLRLC